MELPEICDNMGSTLMVNENRVSGFVFPALMLAFMIILLHLLAVKLLGLSQSKALIVDICVLAVVCVPAYARITKGEKAYAQPSRKYMVKYILFPLGVGVSTFILLMLEVPPTALAIIFIGAFVAENVYFYFL